MYTIGNIKNLNYRYIHIGPILEATHRTPTHRVRLTGSEGWIEKYGERYLVFNLL